MKGVLSWLAPVCALASFACGSALSASSSVEDFYRGKTLTIYVGTSAGGAIDAYPRVMSDYISKYLPGHPTIVVRNLPGASGVHAANFIYSVAPQDGTALAYVTRGILYGPLFGMPGAACEPTKINWIGSTARETSVIAVWSASTPVKTIEDVVREEVVVGATAGSIGNMNVFPELLNNLAGTKFKVIRGYKGAPEVTLALEAGEIQGRGAWSWGSLKSSKMDWLKEGKIRILVQFGLEKAEDLPDVPLALDLVDKPEDRQLVELICAPLSIGYPAFMGPNVPQDRVQAMRKAYAASLKDPAMRAAADKRQLEIDPVTGEEVTDVVARIYAIPQPIVARARDILEPSVP